MKVSRIHELRLDSAPFTECWAHPKSPLRGRGESRVPAGGNGSVDRGQGQHQREQQLLSAAGTAQQVWFVPCSEAVPSSLRSPSNTLCAV